jgi:hypothetical protein
MSYTKHTWADGELVTAAKMNNIENGIEEASSGGGGGVVHSVINGNTSTLDKTWQEIFDGDYTTIDSAIDSYNKTFLMILQVTHDGTYYVMASDGDNQYSFETDSSSGYPSVTIG